MNILITGGAGYIGSHTLIELLDAEHNCVVVDNLCNSSAEALRRVKNLTNKNISFIKGDIRDKNLLTQTLTENQVEAVIHFAGLKSVSESSRAPLRYFDNNVRGSLSLLEAMAEVNVRKLIFSSSATVYGDTQSMPLTETSPLGAPLNPYGRTKLIVEQMLEDLAASDPTWSIGILRYFNPVGAHPSGEIGEDPHGLPNNLLPYVSQVAIGRLSEVQVFGKDYPTRDGTGVRDYIHVIDLARGHLAALQFIDKKVGINVWNLGTGRGYSVLEIIKAFEAVTGVHIPYHIAPRRIGDLAESWSATDKAAHELDWVAQFGLTEMLTDLWRWQTKNPDGYGDHR